MRQLTRIHVHSALRKRPRWGRLVVLGVAAAMLTWTAACAPAAAPEVDAAEPVAESVSEGAPTATSEAVAGAAEDNASTPQAEQDAAAILVPTATVGTETADTVDQEGVDQEGIQGSDWVNTVTVEGDYYILGNPAAPVRLIDYSDFL